MVVATDDERIYGGTNASLRSTYQSRILESHKVDIHKEKIRNVQTDGHGPKINVMYSRRP